MKRQRDTPRGRPAASAVGWIPTLLLLSGVVALWAWSRPAHEDIVVPVEHRADYAFDYSADVRSGDDVYEDRKVTFGAPIYLRVVEKVDVDVTMRLVMPGSTIDSASMSAKATVSSDAGWSRTLAAPSPVAVTDGEASVAFTVDFAEALEIAQELQEATGVEGELYVSVIAVTEAEVHTPDAVAGFKTRVSTTVAGIEFDLTNEVALLQSDTDLSALDLASLAEGAAVYDREGSTEASAPAALARQSVLETIDTVQVEDHTLTMLKWDVRLSHLQIASLAAFGLFVLLALYDALVLLIARHRGEAAFLHARYRAGTFHVKAVPDALLAEAVWVSSFETLSEVAAIAEADILYHTWPGGDRYFVFDGPRIFAYETAETVAHPMRRREDRAPVGSAVTAPVTATDGDAGPDRRQ